MKRSILHKSGLLLPALAWLFIQFAMTGVLAGSSADAMQIEVCLPSGVQTITIDPETGEPAAPSVTGGACDWCQSFGVAVDTAARGDVGWMAIARDYYYRLALAPPPHKPLRLVADYESRGPPRL